jgi:hypothetical protein
MILRRRIQIPSQRCFDLSLQHVEFPAHEGTNIRLADVHASNERGEERGWSRGFLSHQPKHALEIPALQIATVRID